uniref:PPARG related coactivator 1 n=1 Tax=Malurus cyaneus samueli TaxID=2593467 RepID=A0A8C5TGY1_9PASS
MFEVLGVLSPCLQLRLSGALVCCEEISAGGGVVQSVYVAPHALQQCFSLEEDDLNLTSLDAETILEAEEILGTMQNYLDSSVISIIEDLSLSEVCLDAQNELSLLTAITEILDSTDDETLSPFDTIMDAELLTSPRERENPSVSFCLPWDFTVELQQTHSCLSWGHTGKSLGTDVCSGPSSQTDADLVWDCAAHGLEDPMLPKKQVCSTPRVERKVGWHRAREQPLPQRSDGEEEEEEAALSLELDSSMEAVDFCVSEAGMALEEHEDPCIINTGDVSLSELVKSMHPYCLPTFTVCLDPDTEPVARELLSSSVLLEIVPGEGESVEIPVVLKPLTPSSLDLEESIPEDRGELPGAPAQENGMEEEKEEKLPGKEPSCTTPEGTSPPEAAAPGALGPNCSSWHSTEAPASGKRECSEKGRATSRLRAACPSVQVSDFLAQQLERARKEGQMELHAEQALRPWGRRRSTAGPFLPKKVKQELQKEPAPETVSVALEKNKTLVPLEKTTPSMEGQPTATCSSLTDETEGQGDAQSSAEQTSDVLEAASQLPEQSVGLEPALSLPAAEPSEGLPKESKPKALSLREYRIRMLHRQLSEGGSQEGKKQVASKWPSVPEPPTELAEIPCLVSPMRSATEADGAQKGPDKPTSPAAVPPPASKAPTALTAAPAPSTAPAPATAPPTPSTPMPFVAPNVPPAAGVAPTGMPPASAGAYALYPPVPSWPCFSPQPMGCHSLPPPPSASSSNTFHMVPGLPPPAMAWPPPPVPPPPPFGPGGPYAPVGWAPPSYWPGIPMPPPVPSLVYRDPGAAVQATTTFPTGSHPGTAVLHGQPPATPVLSCPEPPAFPAQPPTTPATEAGAAGGPARSATGRVSDPRRQARLAGESTLPKAPLAPAPAQPLPAPSAATAQPSRVPPAVPVSQAATAQPSRAPPAVPAPSAATAQPSRAPPAVPAPSAATAQPSRAPPAVPAPSAATAQPSRAPPACSGAFTGLTPPATPPHQLWKPLPAVSLLAKAKSPGSMPQEGPQKTMKVMKAKPLLSNKIQGKSLVPAPTGTAPSHVCSGDHDYCILGTPWPESSNISGTQPPAEGGSRWNVKHHRDITIKPISSLTKRTLDQPEPTPPAPNTTTGHSQESLGMACLAPLDYRTTIPNKATTGCSSPPTSVLLSPAASPCRDQEVQTPSAQPSHAAAKRSLRCYRRPQDSPSPSTDSWRAGRSRASRSFSSSSDGASESSSSSSSSSSRSRSRSLSPPPKRWRSSSSRSSCGSCGRSRDRSSSSSSTSSYSSRSTSRSQSRSPSPRRRSNRWRRGPAPEWGHPCPQEERRVVFIGKIPSRMTRSELRHRFSVFGDIEECTLHFRSEGDNYGFVTYRYAEEAFAAIESGHKLRRPDEQPFDLCFGGRRQFCRRNYADLDSNREDFDPAPVKSKFDSLDFDTLLRQAQRSLRR